MVGSGHYDLDYCPWALRFWEQENKSLENRKLAGLCNWKVQGFVLRKGLCASGLAWSDSLLSAGPWVCFPDVFCSPASFVLGLPSLLLENGRSRSSPRICMFHLLEWNFHPLPLCHPPKCCLGSQQPESNCLPFLKANTVIGGWSCVRSLEPEFHAPRKQPRFPWSTWTWGEGNTWVTKKS